MVVKKERNLNEDGLENEEELEIDNTLRPKEWNSFIGQEKIKKNIKIIIEAAKKRKESIDHLLFYGNSGLGKTTLAHLIANEMNTSIKITSGPAIEKAGDLAAVLTNLKEGEILFIDEIHRLNRVIEEYLYPAMEDFRLNIIVGKGPMAKTIEITLPTFTLIGATTRVGIISAPLRNRFGATFEFNFYTVDEIAKILKRSAKILGIEADEEALSLIAKSSRFTPRIANHLLKRVRDFAQVKEVDKITKEIAEESLKFLEIDEIGLTGGDRKILETILEKFNGGPVGLKSLAAASLEDEDTILNIYEPYLMQLGFIQRTSQGRIITENALKYLKARWPKNQSFLI